jgi:hypothetical protein
MNCRGRFVRDIRAIVPINARAPKRFAGAV